MLRDCKILAGAAVALFSLSVGCKQKDADLMTASSAKLTEQNPAAQQYEWCKVSAVAWQGLVEAINRMEKAGKSNVSTAAGVQAQAAPLSATTLELLNNPPSVEPKPCGEQYDQALLNTNQQVQVALEGRTSEAALGFGGCEIYNSSGVMSITKLASGNYRIEILGCGGRERSEMIVSPTQLRGLAGTLLRGV